MRTQSPPPFPLGSRIRYAGTASFSYGGPFIQPGDIGIVVENVAAQEGTGIWLDVLEGPDEGLPGYSVVEFHGHPKAHCAIDATSTDQYEAI